VFNSDGSVPEESTIQIYAYIPSRPNEILDKSLAGCGYGLDSLFNGWLWFEAGNYFTPWSINENLRIIVIDTLLQETGSIDLVLDGSGNQHISDLYLSSGDNVGPIASNAMVDSTSPASIPEGTISVTLTANLDDSMSGNSDIQGAEYFVDTDPGLGSGIPMNPTDGLFDNVKESVTALVDTSSWTEGSTHTIYVRGQDSAGNWGTTHMVVVSITMPVSIKGDLDGDGDVDRNDLNILLLDRNKPVADSACGSACDLDGDGIITGLDARKLVLLCTRPRCATE